MARSLAEHRNNHENDNLISELWLVELNPVCADKLAGFVTYWSSGKSVWSPCGGRKHTSSAGEQTSTEHRRSPLSESRLSFLFYLGFSIARLRLLRQWFSLFRSAAFPQLFQLFHRHLGLATEENNASSCWRWQMRSLRAVVRPLSIKVKKRAGRRFIGDRPCCQLSALCNLNLLQNDNVKAEKVFHCQFSERREVKETVNH